MADIFLSYASEDLARVKLLVAALEEHGWSVWWDRELVAGPSFDRKIEQALNDAQCVVVVWSSHSIESRWVRAEANEGLDRDVLVPVLFDDVRPPLPFRMSHMARLSGWPGRSDGLPELLKGIEELLGAAANDRPEVPGTSTDKTSIAVLPFVNMSNDPDQEYFSDGISEDILNGLAKFHGLIVKARTSSFAFKGKNEDIRSIGKQLNVTHVLEGSVRQAGGRVRVTAQLIDTREDAHIWSEQYNRELSDIFEVQDEISSAILDALNVHLTQAESRPTREMDIAAYNVLLRGRQNHAMGRVEQAIESYEMAVSLDPECAECCAALAHELQIAKELGLRSGVGTETLIEEHISKASELDPDERLVAVLEVRREWLHRERSAQRVIDRYSELICRWPHDIDLLWDAGAVFLSLGLTDLARRCMRRCVDVDPLNIGALAGLTIAYRMAGNEEEALKAAERAAELGNGGPFVLALCAADTGDVDVIQAQLNRSEDAWGVFAYQRPIYAGIVAGLSDDRAGVNNALESVEYAAGDLALFVRSLAAAIAGDLERALICYAEAIDAGISMALWSVQQPFPRALYPDLQSHDGYQQMLREFGFDRESVSKLQIPEKPFLEWAE